MLKLEEYVIELFSTKYAIRECNDIKLIDEFLILSCYSETNPESLNFDAHVIILKPVPGGTKLQSKLEIVADYTHKSFLDVNQRKKAEDKTLVNPILVEAMKYQNDEARVIIYQARNYQKNVLETSNNYSLLKLVISTDRKVSLTNPLDKTLTWQALIPPAVPTFFISRICLLNKSNFLLEDANKKLIYQYKVTSDLEKKPTLVVYPVHAPTNRPAPDTDISQNRLQMRSMYAYYDHKSFRGIIYYSDYKSCVRCRVQMEKGYEGVDSTSIPLIGTKCKSITLEFSQIQSQTMFAGDYGHDSTENSIILSYYDKKPDSNSGLTGYLNLNFDKYRTMYSDLQDL